MNATLILAVLCAISPVVSAYSQQRRRVCVQKHTSTSEESSKEICEWVAAQEEDGFVDEQTFLGLCTERVCMRLCHSKRSLLPQNQHCYCDSRCNYTHETGNSCVCSNAQCDCRPFRY